MPISSYIINATNVYITINDQWVDEAVSISVQRQAHHQMVYGYMDVDPRRPVRGNAIVVGTIGIHHRSADYIHRYLTNSPSGDRGRIEQIERKQEALKQFETDADILAFMATLDVNGEEFKELTEAIERNAISDPTRSDTPGDASPDPVGEDGFNASITGERKKWIHSTKGRTYLGNTIKIYYGDAQEESFAEAIHGFIITGEAMSPVENTAGVSADPLMKFYSFIAARIDPAKI